MRNTLFYGDNLDILRKKIRDESVDLCYIDPPFNSKRNYNQIYNNIGNEDFAQEQAFIDTWTWNDQARDGFKEIISNHLGRFTEQTIELIDGLHRVLGEGSLLAYLVSITLRLIEINRVLKPTGSFYLHCDSSASHYLKIIIDSVFLPNGGNFVNEIIWKRTTAHSDAKQGRKAYGNVTDTLLFYSKAGSPVVFNQQHQQYSNKYLKKYRHKDTGGRHYRLDNLTGPGGAAKGNPSYEVMGVTRYWRYSREKMQELIRQGRVVQTKPGSVPQYKRYLDEMPGNPLQNLWDDINPVNSQANERLGYPTQKPEALLERIIKVSSNDGDVILDAYCGCGTTIAVAQRLNRRWIGMDITYQAIAIILARLEDQFGKEVADAVMLDGIPKDMASAKALAHRKDDRVRKEFEKWAILTYTNNRAIVRQKKGADGGVDGVFYFWNGGDGGVSKMVLQTKSGGVQRKDIAALRGDMDKESAAVACLITLEAPTKPMMQDAKAAGIYENRTRGIRCDRIRIVRVEEIIQSHHRLELPLHYEALNKAQRDQEGSQLMLDLRPPKSDDLKPERKLVSSVPRVVVQVRKRKSL
ncbi:MAG TPA: DNA methyltransferase [Terriglobales bacterium]|jgi:site-specific DNA-methyltransferase (adenine-specific)